MPTTLADERGLRRGAKGLIIPFAPRLAHRQRYLPFNGSSGLRVWSGAQSVSEASGVDEGSGDVVGGVAESLGDVA